MKCERLERTVKAKGRGLIQDTSMEFQYGTGKTHDKPVIRYSCWDLNSDRADYEAGVPDDEFEFNCLAQDSDVL